MGRVCKRCTPGFTVIGIAHCLLLFLAIAGPLVARAGSAWAIPQHQPAVGNSRSALGMAQPRPGSAHRRADHPGHIAPKAVRRKHAAMHGRKHVHRRSRPASSRHVLAKAKHRHRAVHVTQATKRRRPRGHSHSVARSRASIRLANRPLIVIDPGHGGRDPGAIGASGTLEKTVTLAAARQLRHALAATGRYRTVLTRSGDRTVSLGDRLAFVRKHDADLLIAIHADASPNHSARGASVYISNRNVTARYSGDRRNAGRIARALAADPVRPEPGSDWLQYAMIDQLANDIQMVATPARQAGFYMLRSRTIPSALLEMGFISNRRDEALLRKPSHRRVLVQAIKDAIDDYFRAIRRADSRT
jgi:N-acetylmuramoyl-L-alanine amidase